MDYLAHSALDKDGILIPSQTYQSHIVNTLSIVKRHLVRTKKYVRDPEIYSVIEKSTILAVTYHDLGKLLDQPQKVLNGESQGKMLNHVSAGVIYLLNQYAYNNKFEYLISAYLIHAHHIGFLNFDKIIGRKSNGLILKYSPRDGFKDKRSCEMFGLENITVDSYSERNMSRLLEIHDSFIKKEEFPEINQKKAMVVLTKYTLLKICLAILCDSDHEDTSKNYKEPYPYKSSQLFAEDRLKKLVAYIEEKGGNATSRNVMRSKFFDICKNSPKEDLFLIDGTVGIGKTYAGFACALDACIKEGFDNINDVLPYISLIEQTQKAYAEAVSFSEKDAEFNISSIHSLCESKNLFHRKFYKNFNSPINITTSVNFFNVLISNKTPVFKNFHKIIGSVTILDEYHCYAGYDLWPIILSLLKEMTIYFKIKICFCSGSPTEYWNLEYMDDFKGVIDVKNIVPKLFYDQMLEIEKNRVRLSYELMAEQLSFKDILDKVNGLIGSLFIVFNTRKGSNRFYKYILGNSSGRKVYLRYSALAPKDRERQFENIKKDLAEGKDIILVATQGADIGLDISFRNGLKEASSSHSVMQMMGRINRNCEYEDSSLFVFKMKKDPDGNGEIKGNPSIKSATEVFLDNVEDGLIISPDVCTETAQKEVDKMGNKVRKEMEIAYKCFEDKAFEDIDNNFKMINMPTLKILVNRGVYDRIIKGDFVKWHDIQENIVTIYRTEGNLKKFGHFLTPIITPKLNDKEGDDKGAEEESDLFVWNGEYDSENEGIMKDGIFTDLPAPLVV